MSELRITDTNSANDSRGRAFGLEGNDFIFVVVGFVLALGLYLGLTMLVRVQVPLAAILVLPVLLMPTAWVLLFRHNKPAGYAEDWFDHHLSGAGWSFLPRTQPHPPQS
jgi:hypothetical protein